MRQRCGPFADLSGFGNDGAAPAALPGPALEAGTMAARARSTAATRGHPASPVLGLSRKGRASPCPPGFTRRECPALGLPLPGRVLSGTDFLPAEPKCEAWPLERKVYSRDNARSVGRAHSIPRRATTASSTPMAEGYRIYLDGDTIRNGMRCTKPRPLYLLHHGGPAHTQGRASQVNSTGAYHQNVYVRIAPHPYPGPRPSWGLTSTR